MQENRADSYLRFRELKRPLDDRHRGSPFTVQVDECCYSRVRSVQKATLSPSQNKS